MNRKFLLIIGLLICSYAHAQVRSYTDAINKYQKKYCKEHEVVKGKDKQYFRFYPVNADYKVSCKFEKSNDTTNVPMKTSGVKVPIKDFTRYGKISFTIHDTLLQLTVYQSKGLVGNPQYKDYLFIPFTDLTSGEETYGGGRYIDIVIGDIKNNILLLDFNKAYNPYCAYTTGYNCPIPPRENNLAIAILAGEKAFGKTH